MTLVNIQNTEEFNRIRETRKGPLVVGFFGSFSKASRETESSFRKFAESSADAPVLYVDVSSVRGLHKNYGVSSVPTVVAIQDGRVIRKVVGKQDADYYTNAFSGNHSVSPSSGEKKKGFPPVTVWVSDSCPWCKRVKTYLRKNRVPFREVNVSRDPGAASALQARTGQTGVPQLSIGGRYVVGFDQKRIDEYLGLKPGNGA